MIDELIVNEIKLLNGFYKYIRQHKGECVMDLMVNYCDEVNIPVEALGHLISEDKCLKDYVARNLEKYNFIKSENNRKSDLLSDF